MGTPHLAGDGGERSREDVADAHARRAARRRVALLVRGALGPLEALYSASAPLRQRRARKRHKVFPLLQRARVAQDLGRVVRVVRVLYKRRVETGVGSRARQRGRLARRRLVSAH